MADTSDIEKEDNSETMEASAEVIHIANQAKETFTAKGHQWNTYFYKIVLSGNVKVTKEVVEYMKDNSMENVLDWLWQRASYEEMAHHKRRKSGKLRVLRILMFIAFVVVDIILTPVFYALHIMSTMLLNREQRRISSKIRLPLAFAAISQSKELMAYFLSQGVEIDHVDKYGNNVFHYISDLSSVAAQSAIDIFQNTVSFIDDSDMVRELLIEQRNSSGLTAIEYVAKFGSPALLSKILTHPNLLQHISFASCADGVHFAALESEDLKPSESSASDNAKTRLEIVDVSKYESGSIMDQSSLLNILSDRDVAKMNKEDLQMFEDGQLVGKWVKLKTKQMLVGVMTLQCIDVAITGVLLYLLSTSFIGTHGSTFRSWMYQQDITTVLREVQTWGHGYSDIYTYEAYTTLIEELKDKLEDRFINKLRILEPEKADLLFNKTLKDKYDDLYTVRWNVTFAQPVLDELFDQAIQMDEFKGNITELFSSRNVSVVVREYGKLFEAIKAEDYIGVYSDSETHQEYNNLTIEFGFNEIQPSLVLPAFEIRRSLLCVSGSDPKAIKRYTHEEVDQEFINATHDSCFTKMVLDISRGLCKGIDKMEIAQYIYPKNLSRFSISLVITGSVAVLYILLDIFERCVFRTMCTKHHSTLKDMVSSALRQKVPGSYARKQLNMISYLCILLAILYEQIQWSARFDYKDIADYFENRGAGEIVFIVAVVVRFLMHIHTMRLLPGIGHFVITTFMMGTNLLHFSAVFGMVLSIFSVLFYILIDDPKCPLQNKDGFLWNVPTGTENVCR